ncbi:uncharacterized protein HMPREF1541_00948 [Cyphellophora europaea CBS 101466]|uniref:Uncharacterized protein n=1 Tax=Cyphellophora europaea (strain CBS 101466) TaxID=1220924 RepID=W2SFT1_CYPE1|nr:uncharacterized protein HMPREF1541_00948 [Cyphellophora europaea CBS 101466]ETN46759.1 hypothetical protein HMPREF1541_00948 [Cyphellophora europaea CBS 101466]
MSPTSVRSACDRLLSGIFASIKVLSYESVPVTDYLRQKDIESFKDGLAALSPVLIRLREKDHFFPTKPKRLLVAILDECDVICKQSQKLLDREHGTFALTAATNPKSTWACATRDQAFLLRHQLTQHRGTLEIALAVANTVSAASTARHLPAKMYAEDLERNLFSMKPSLQTVLGVRVPAPDPESTVPRAILKYRNEVIMPRDIGITSPSRALLIFLDDLLAFAAGVVEATELPDSSPAHHRENNSLHSLSSRSS